VPSAGNKGKGIEHLRPAILKPAPAPTPGCPVPRARKEEVGLVGGGLAILAPLSPVPRGEGRGGGHLPPSDKEAPHPNPLPRIQGRGDKAAAPVDFTRCKALAERLLIGDRAADIAPLANQQPVSSLLNSA